jgi:gamma-glutamylcyclotransferase (GGCT)/AIG2-like uncharacterized protein YtfP
MAEATTADRRRRAYQAGGRLARERMRSQAAEDHEALDRVQSSDVVVVKGVYDHVEQVLGSLGLPFVEVHAGDVERLDLQPHQLLVVNCPGEISEAAVARVRGFVESGGSLFTTDWALDNVIEQAFPGLIASSGVSTLDDVVRLDAPPSDNPFLTGVVDGADDPQWWLEGASHPIRVLHPSVEVLLSSEEMGVKWGDPAIAVLFPFGRGEVFHMVSHYYLQRTELRTGRHARRAASYLAEKGLTDPDLASAVDGLHVGEVESAATSARLFANVVANKKRRSESGAAETSTPPAQASGLDPKPKQKPKASAGPVVDVFVYGNHQPGQPGFSVIEPFVHSAHRSAIRGELYDLTHRAGARIDRGVTTVINGWVLRLVRGSEEAALAVLDIGSGAKAERCRHTTVRGRPVLTYRWTGDPRSKRRIPDGTWKGPRP